MAATAVKHAGMNLLPTTQALCNVTVSCRVSVSTCNNNKEKNNILKAKEVEEIT